MNRLVAIAGMFAVVWMGVATAQQPMQPRPQTATRSYRSYSVAPSTRATTAAPRSRGASDATWRHADTKAAGQYHSGR